MNGCPIPGHIKINGAGCSFILCMAGAVLHQQSLLVIYAGDGAAEQLQQQLEAQLQEVRRQLAAESSRATALQTQASDASYRQHSLFSQEAQQVHTAADNACKHRCSIVTSSGAQAALHTETAWLKPWSG